MAVLAFSQARLRCDGPCQSRSRATSPPQDAHALRKLLSHLPFGRAIYLRPAEPITSPLGIDCSIKAYNLYGRRRAGKVYPHEIDIQETHPKHRKLDSQPTLSHRARGRAADGLRA